MYYQFLLLQAVLVIFAAFFSWVVFWFLFLVLTFLTISLLIKFWLEIPILMFFHNILVDINHLILLLIFFEGTENTPLLKALKIIFLPLGSVNTLFWALLFLSSYWHCFVLQCRQILQFSLLIILVHEQPYLSRLCHF